MLEELHFPSTGSPDQDIQNEHIKIDKILMLRDWKGVKKMGTINKIK